MLQCLERELPKISPFFAFFGPVSSGAARQSGDSVRKDRLESLFRCGEDADREHRPVGEHALPDVQGAAGFEGGEGGRLEPDQPQRN